MRKLQTILWSAVYRIVFSERFANSCGERLRLTWYYMIIVRKIRIMNFLFKSPYPSSVMVGNYNSIPDEYAYYSPAFMPNCGNLYLSLRELLLWGWRQNTWQSSCVKALEVIPCRQDFAVKLERLGTRWGMFRTAITKQAHFKIFTDGARKIACHLHNVTTPFRQDNLTRSRTSSAKS